MTSEIPAGFEPHFRQSPFTDPWEPLYSKKTEKAVTMGLRLAKAHTNARGLIHGGLIASLADNSMGYSCAQATGWTTSFVTVIPAAILVAMAVPAAEGALRLRARATRSISLIATGPVFTGLI